MALTDYTAYKNAVESWSANQNGFYTKATASGGGTATSGFVSSIYLLTPRGASAPTSAVAPTNATANGLLFDTDFLDITNKYFIGKASFRFTVTSNNEASAAALLLIDRLSHQGGLSGTVTTAQTTNLPTAALTRNTGGVGNMIGLQIYTSIGATATTVTCGYTNQAGTAGRTTQATVFGGGTADRANVVVICPLQDGDTGVKSVENVTVLASTLTAGNFGVLIFKPIMLLPACAASQGFVDIPSMFAGKTIQVPAHAHLDGLVMSTFNGTIPTCTGHIQLIETS